MYKHASLVIIWRCTIFNILCTHEVYICMYTYEEYKIKHEKSFTKFNFKMIQKNRLVV